MKNLLNRHIAVWSAVVISLTASYSPAIAQGGNPVVDCAALPWEANLSHELNTIESGALRDVSKITSASMIPMAIVTPISFYAIGYLAGGEYSTRVYSMESGVQIATAIGTTYLASLALKHAADRLRPYQANPTCITAYNSDADGSWPSGHSAGSAALAVSLCLRYPKWYVIAPSVAYTLYMGFSRIHLGMHYLSDVVSGYALGSLIAVGVHALRHELFGVVSPLLQPHVSGGGTTTPTNQYTPILDISIPF